MFEAARLTDPIAHTCALEGFLVGAVIGIALIAAVAFATFTCGFGVALLAGLAAGIGATAILGLGEAIGRMFSNPSGTLGSASPDVFVNRLGAACTTMSTAICDKHNPAPLVAEGSGSVFINGLPAARKDDAITCGAKIDDGSHDVFIGGGRVGYLPVEDEVPEWLRTTVGWAFALAGLVGGLAGLVKAAGGLSRAVVPCAAKFIGGFMLGEAVGHYVAEPVVRRVMGGLYGRPVEVATGRKVLLAQDEVDFVVPGPLPIVLARFYASDLALDASPGGGLGAGWVLPWELRLQRRDERLWLRDAQGRETGFPPMAPGQALYSAGEQRYLVRARDGRYLMVDLNERYYDFGQLDQNLDAVAWLQRIEDRCGQWQAFARDDAGRVRAIRASGGLDLRLDYCPAHPERLAGIVRLDGDPRQLVGYDYDALGQLVAVTDANGAVVRRFGYQNGVMTSHTGALGLVSHYAWADIGGRQRVVACWSSEGERAEFTYDLEARQTTVRDELGREACWRYDEQLRIVACTDLDGGAYRIRYDDAGQPTHIALPGERSVAFEYDAAGRIVLETDPLGRRTATSYDGDSLRVTQTILPGGARWRAGYDHLGRLLNTTDPLGRVERHEYAPGLGPWPVAHVDARGARRTMAWNALGQLTAYTDCSGKTTRYAYDAAGYLETVTDALGQQTRFERLPTGEPARIILPDGSVQEFAYDAAGLPVGQRYREVSMRWRRNARGQVVEALDPAERRLSYRYDPRGRLVELASGPDTRYDFAYDSGDRLVREIRPDGVERQLGYDAAGELVELEKLGASAGDPLARARRTMRFERDGMGRLLRQTCATSVSTYAWNDADRLVAATRAPLAAGSALGVTSSSVSFDYDVAGRLLAEHGAEGTVRYELDELDNLAAIDLPHGQRIEQLCYGAGHVHQLRVGGRVVSDIERDDLHREILRTQGRIVQRTGYDVLGRRGWQAAGLLGQALGPGDGQLWRGYRYDLQGELGEVHDSVRGRIDYRYDRAGHLLRQSRAADLEDERFAWDAAGNLLDGSGKADGDGSRGRVEGNRLKVWRDIRYEYDPWGNVSHKRKGARQDQRFTFDAEDRLTGVWTEDAQGVVETRFEYDPLGRRIACSETRRDVSGLARSQRRRFVWQGLRMAQEVREGSVSSYVYSPDAMYTPLARVDALVAGAIADVTIDKARSSSRVYHFHTDPVGTPLELTDEAGELEWAGKYSAWGRVEHGEDAMLLERTEQPLRYPGQYADKGTGLHYNTFRYYDPDVGRFVSQDPIGLSGGLNLYAYASNPTAWIDPWGWISESAPGYAVYGLYAPGSDNPYYVGVTDDLLRRSREHRLSGRMPEGAKMSPIARNVTYGTARGIEQAHIEYLGTKTGTVGFDLQQAVTYEQRGNKVASFAHDNTTRPRGRQAYFESAYRDARSTLAGGCG